MDGCEGLEAKSYTVDHSAGIIYLHYDQFCQDTAMCTQAIHCDTAHYVISGLYVADYLIMVVDSNESNHVCDSSLHVTNLDSDTLNVRSFSIDGYEVTAKTGTQQCVPFSVTGFNELNTLQLSLQWDTLMILYDTVRNLYPINSFTPGSVSLRSIDDLRVIWFDFDVDGENIPDNEIMFEVCFNVIGNPGDTAIISYNEEFIPVEVEDIDGNRIEVTALDGAIYISEDRYGTCEADSADILCQEWVMDSVLSRIAEYCQKDSAYFELYLVDWRGWEVLRFSSGTITDMGEMVGNDVYFSCEGEYIGTCVVGGFGGGFCDNVLLTQDVTLKSKIWACGEPLPGCYTTSTKDSAFNKQLLINNISSDRLLVNPDYVSSDFVIFNSNGQVVVQESFSTSVDISTLTSGIYYIRSGEQVERFVKID